MSGIVWAVKGCNGERLQGGSSLQEFCSERERQRARLVWKGRARARKRETYARLITLRVRSGDGLMLQVCLIHGDGFGCARVYAVRGEGREEETSRRSWQGWWSSRGETDNGPPEEPHSCLRTTSSPVARPRSRALWPGQRARPSGFAGRLLPSCESLHALQRTPPGAVRLGKGGGPQAVYDEGALSGTRGAPASSLERLPRVSGASG